MNNYSIDEVLNPLYAAHQEAADSPLIGITTNSGGEDFSVRQRYCEMVVRAGGVPVLLTPLPQVIGNREQGIGDMCEQLYARQLDSVDAVIFTGGGDHNPLWSGEEPVPELHSINSQRDRHELPLCRLAYNRQMPMLGICRGMQTIAVALGGHVEQHISTKVKHSQDAPKSEPTHTINIVKDSMLCEAYGKERILVNSFHHQAVDDAGKRFRIVATAADGVAEAMESAEFRQIMGVQWHPEQMGDDGLPVFKWLVDSARVFRKAKDLHRRMLTIDSHCDTPMFFPQGVNFLQRDPRILYDLHKMDDGRIDAVQMVCYLPQPKMGEKFSDKVDFNVSGPAEYADLIFDKIDEICMERPDRLSIACTPADIHRDKREGRHSIVLGIENGLALEHDIRNVQHFRQRGITYITLCHNGDNDICDSARGSNTFNGVSKFGKTVIEEMNRQGVMVDLSHASERSFYDAINYSATPIVCSHSNCRALCDHPRNLTDDQMRALANCGGVMQITMYNGFLRMPDAPASLVGVVGSPVSSEATIMDVIRHLEYAINIMGIDHVGIGTDFDGDGGVPGLADASQLINLTQLLIRRGYTTTEIEKIWGRNWLRVMSICQNYK